MMVDDGDHDDRFEMSDATMDEGKPRDAAARLRRVQLDREALQGLSPLQEADRRQAVADLEFDNHFALLPSPSGVPAPAGPFVLHLAVREGRLILDVRSDADAPLIAFGLALGPFRRLLKDYQLLVDSYGTAMAEGREARIQAIDMGRRGLHNEGAELLLHRLKGKVSIDHETARRLFTLVCVLHQRI
jgi:uncharacterized protein (UPF0262 family)